MSFLGCIVVTGLIGLIASEVAFGLTGNISYLIAACIILLTNIPNIVYLVRNA